jgi:hypothetical protein
MSLQSYADLQAAIGTWNVNRTDLPATDLIALAEARLNRDLRLRVMETDNPLSAAIGLRTIPLPAGFLEPLALFLELASGREELAFVPDRMDTSASPGQPWCWSVDGSNLVFERPADQAYAFTLKMLTAFALSDAAPTNWLLANHPDLYLAACNAEAALWLVDDEQFGRWAGRYGEILASVNAHEARSRAPAALRADPALQPAALRQGVFDIIRGS